MCGCNIFPCPACPSSGDIHKDTDMRYEDYNRPATPPGTYLLTCHQSENISPLPTSIVQALHILFLFYSLEQVVKYSESNFISCSEGIVFNSFCRKYKIHDPMSGA